MFTFQVLYKTSADYDDADDYIWQEEGKNFQRTSEFWSLQWLRSFELICHITFH